jgi:hypothetical protein
MTAPLKNRLGQTVEQCVRYHSLTLWKGNHRLRSLAAIARSARACERASASHVRTNTPAMAEFYREVASRLRALAEVPR